MDLEEEVVEAEDISTQLQMSFIRNCTDKDYCKAAPDIKGLLLDDNFTTICLAVEESKRMFDGGRGKHPLW